MCREPHRNGGFSLLSAMFLVLVLGSLGVFMVKLASVQQMTAVMDLEGARAYQLAKAGTDYAIYQVLQNGSCANANLTFSDAGFGGWVDTITCTATGTYPDGTNIKLYHIVSTACNIPQIGSCPGAANGFSYVERRLSTTISR